jgi:hypothetical protein
MQPSTERLQQIAAMFADHDAQLHRVVERRGSPEHATVEDACAYAWAQLLTADHIDLGPTRWRALAWLDNHRHPRGLAAEPHRPARRRL